MENNLCKEKKTIKRKIFFLKKKKKLNNNDLHKLFHLYDELDHVEEHINKIQKYEEVDY